jgi:hypothetical protein
VQKAAEARCFIDGEGSIEAFAEQLELGFRYKRDSHDTFGHWRLGFLLNFLSTRRA